MRKIFNLENLSESKIVKWTQKNDFYPYSISAGGCLFYKIINNKIKLLLIEYDDKTYGLDDLGGKTDDIDNTPIETIAREVEEETNLVITKNMVNTMIINNHCMTFYNQYSRYFMILILVHDGFFPDDTIFGTYEIHDNIKRKIKWFDYDECKPNLAYRLSKNNELISYLDRLNNMPK